MKTKDINDATNAIKRLLAKNPDVMIEEEIEKKENPTKKGKISFTMECPECKTTFEVSIVDVGKPPFDTSCPNCTADVGSEFIVNWFRENPRSPGEVDEVMARELLLFIQNDGNLYRQHHLPIINTLLRKKKRGVYNSQLAVKAFMYLVESGAKKYTKESSPTAKWYEFFNMATRIKVAEDLRDDFEVAYKSGAASMVEANPCGRENPSKVYYEGIDKGKKWSISQDEDTGMYSVEIRDKFGDVESASICKTPEEYTKWFEEHGIDIFKSKLTYSGKFKKNHEEKGRWKDKELDDLVDEYNEYNNLRGEIYPRCIGWHENIGKIFFDFADSNHLSLKDMIASIQYLKNYPIDGKKNPKDEFPEDIGFTEDEFKRGTFADVILITVKKDDKYKQVLATQLYFDEKKQKGTYLFTNPFTKERTTVEFTEADIFKGRQALMQLIGQGGDLKEIFENPAATVINSILFNKKIWNKESAEEWLEDHNFQSEIFDEPSWTYLRAPQRTMRGIREVRTKAIQRKGILFVYGIRKGAPRRNPCEKNPADLIEWERRLKKIAKPIGTWEYDSFSDSGMGSIGWKNTDNNYYVHATPFFEYKNSISITLIDDKGDQIADFRYTIMEKSFLLLTPERYLYYMNRILKLLTDVKSNPDFDNIKKNIDDINLDPKKTFVSVYTETYDTRKGETRKDAKFVKDWEGTLQDFFDINVDGIFEEEQEDIMRSILKEGEYIGGGGAAPYFKIVKKN